MRKGDMKKLGRLLGYMGNQTWAFIIGVICMSAFMTYMQFVLAKMLKDIGIIAASPKEIAMQALVTSVIYFLAGMFSAELLEMAGRYLTGRASAHFNTNLRMDAFNSVLKMRMNRAEREHSASILSRLNNDIDAARRVLTDTIQWTIVPIIAGTISFVYIFSVSWALGLTVLITSVLEMQVSLWMARPMRSRAQRYQAALAVISEKFSDILAGAAVIRSFNIASIMHAKLDTATTQGRKASMSRQRLEAVHEPVSHFVGIIGFLCTIIIGVWQVAANNITVADILMITQLSNNSNWMIRAMGDFTMRLQNALAGADRVFELIDEQNEDENYGSEIPDMHADIAIKFENVQIKYDDSIVVDNLNLVINRNEWVAIAGESGGGKTTVLKAILQFVQPSEGEIKLFGQPAHDFDLAALRRQIAYVPQDTPLMDGTFMMNIRAGRLDATDEEIHHAAKMACIHDFIITLPQGYETQVGERGVQLSGGQRQRVAIARAFLKDAPILLLDEATSALDSENEAQVQLALNNLMSGRTILVVAHRLSTIKKADRILVMDDGAIAESGKHDDLLMRGGIYARLYNLQFNAGKAAV